MIALPSVAQDIATFGRVEAMGRAGAANPSDNTSITLNPAALGLNKRYELQAGFTITKGPDTGLNISVADSKTSVVALGIAYHRMRYAGGDDSREWPGWTESGTAYERRKRFDNVTLAIAYPLLDNRLSFGLNGTLSSFKHDVQGKGVTGNIDFGIAGKPTEAWTIGIVGRNLLPVSGCSFSTTQTRPCIPDYDMGVLVGTYLGTPEIGTLALDVDIHITGPEKGPPVSVRAGIQKIFKDLIVFNTGYRWEGPSQEHWMGLGVGMTRNNTGLHYTLGIPLHPKPWEPLLMTHMLSIRVVTMGSQVDSSAMR